MRVLAAANAEGGGEGGGMKAADWPRAEEMVGAFEIPSAELDVLAEELALRGVPFLADRMSVAPIDGGPSLTLGWHVVYPSGGRRVSVIWSRVSYGHQFGLLEVWDYDEGEGPRGWIDAGEVLRTWPPDDGWGPDYI